MSEVNPSGPNPAEVKSISRLLTRIAEIAEQSSLTGSLEKGVSTSIQQYNTAVQHLEKIGAVSAGFFPPLAADTDFDAVGVASALLASYLGDGEDAANGANGTTYNGAKYIVNRTYGSDVSTEELRELRDLLRQQLHPTTE